jgi:hypothetical protein
MVQFHPPVDMVSQLGIWTLLPYFIATHILCCPILKKICSYSWRLLNNNCDKNIYWSGSNKFIYSTMASPSWYGLSNRYLEPTTIFSWYPHPLFPYSEFGIILFWESIELLYIHSIAQYWSLSKVFMYTIVTPNLCVLPNRFLEHATIFDCYPHPLFPYSIKLVMIQFWEIFELLCINITQYSRQTKVFKYTIVTQSWYVLPNKYLDHATI